MAKKRTPPVFKYIVKRKQKRKDGKIVYYYYNYTDKKIESKQKYERGLETRKKFKEKYGKDFIKKFKQGVTQIKQIERAEKKYSLDEMERIVKEYQKKTGYPKIPREAINFSGLSESTDILIRNIPLFIRYNNRYYKLEKTDILDLGYFFFYIVDTFMNALRSTYKDRYIKSQTKKGLSPMCLFPIGEFINSDYPEAFVFYLDKAYSSEGFEKLVTLFNKLVREAFNEYLFNLPVYNIYEFIFKSKKK